MTRTFPPPAPRAVLSAAPSVCPSGFGACAPVADAAMPEPAAGAVLGVTLARRAAPRRRGTTAADARGPGG